jgi:Na+-driven multidrug efflux pump
MFAALMRAVGNSRAPLWFLVISSLLNVALDLLFVVVLDTGVAGAAAATVIAQAVSGLLAGVYVFRSYRPYLPERADLRVPRALLAELFSTGLSMALMSCVVDLGSVIINRSNNLLGQALIAANTAGRRMWSLMLMPQSAVSVANSTFMAQNWGARKVERIRTALRQVFAVVTAWSLFACLVFFLMGEWLIRLTTGTSDPAIIGGAVLLTRAALVCAPALGILVCMRNTLQALGCKLVPVLSSCIELGMKILSANYAVPAFGFTAMALTEPVTWVIMMLYLVGAYLLRRKAIFGEE